MYINLISFVTHTLARTHTHDVLALNARPVLSETERRTRTKPLLLVSLLTFDLLASERERVIECMERREQRSV